jgi:hypothetical protein
MPLRADDNGNTDCSLASHPLRANGAQVQYDFDVDGREVVRDAIDYARAGNVVLWFRRKQQLSAPISGGLFGCPVRCGDRPSGSRGIFLQLRGNVFVDAQGHIISAIPRTIWYRQRNFV